MPISTMPLKFIIEYSDSKIYIHNDNHIDKAGFFFSINIHIKKSRVISNERTLNINIGPLNKMANHIVTKAYKLQRIINTILALFILSFDSSMSPFIIIRLPTNTPCSSFVPLIG